ncbi:c-type cytochrome [Comamonas sp.]|uniref:c-type cytochrome n=1 Tax=Comamonas sp. TaxID=34028 RepID=UPI003A94BA5E
MLNKPFSSRKARFIQGTALAAVLATGSILGLSAWAQKQAQASSHAAPEATTSAAAATAAKSNLVPPHGQEGPQPMVTMAPHSPAQPIAGATSGDALIRGEYLARMGDCVACHTAPGGKPFAGGLAMASPIGTMYSSNITPDAKTGIGSYSFADFDQAVRHGYAKDKGSLYPAMPYPSYARVTEQDMQDMYAYFMKGVQPVESQPRENDIPWPLSMRWPLGIWRALFAPDAAQVQQSAAAVAPTVDARLRGAYLVEGLGHCGSCHTPRSVTMAEKALTAGEDLYLAGGNTPIDGWIAKSLRGDQDGLVRWSEEDIVALLKTGRNDHSAVFGGMAEVIEHSTQYLSDSDLKAMAVYLKSLPAGRTGGDGGQFAASDDTANALWKGDVSRVGAALYLDNCAACHRSDGKGYAQVFPALAGNTAVLTGDPSNLVAIVLQGHKLPATRTRPSTFTMPAFGWRLSDQQVADVSSFVRAGWGNQAGQVSASQVGKVRAAQEKAAKH